MKKISAFLTCVLFAIISACAQKSPVFVESDKAIRGYDPVAYFRERRPIQGKPEFVYSWDNARWLFSSQQNLDSFKTNPVKFAPQYGGYCAYGLSEGHKAPTSPDAWTIVNGKLYLNYNTQVRSSWRKNQQERINQADKNWPEIKNEE